MIDIEPGQYAVIQTKIGGARVVRADHVTAKQIKTRRGSGYYIEARSTAIFAGSKEKAELVAEAIYAARDERRQALREASEAFNIATRPAAEIRDEAHAAAHRAERDAILQIIEAAK